MPAHTGISIGLGRSTPQPRTEPDHIEDLAPTDGSAGNDRLAWNQRSNYASALQCRPTSATASPLVAVKQPTVTSKGRRTRDVGRLGGYVVLRLEREPLGPSLGRDLRIVAVGDADREQIHRVLRPRIGLADPLIVAVDRYLGTVELHALRVARPQRDQTPGEGVTIRRARCSSSSAARGLRP